MSGLKLEQLLLYVTTHTGHTFHVCHLPIPHDIMAQLTVQLKDGVSVTRIMEKIRVENPYKANI